MEAVDVELSLMTLRAIFERIDQGGDQRPSPHWLTGLFVGVIAHRLDPTRMDVIVDKVIELTTPNTPEYRMEVMKLAQGILRDREATVE